MILNTIAAIFFFLAALVLLLVIIIAPTMVGRPRKPYTGADVGAIILLYLVLVVIFVYSGVQLLHG